jgi:hypothetical protein
VPGRPRRGTRRRPEAGVRGVVGEYTGLAGREAQLQHHGVQRRGFVAGDLQRLEQVAEAELQPGHARMRRGQRVREAQPARALDVEEQADRLADAVRAFGRFERLGCRQHVLDRFDLGQVQQREPGADHGSHIGLEVLRAARVDPRDQRLARGARGGAGQQALQRLACIGLAIRLTESSRSKESASASPRRALSNSSGRDPGTKSLLRMVDSVCPASA